MSRTTSLYLKALSQFRDGAHDKYHDPKDQELLREFLKERGSPEDTKGAAESLKDDAGKKYGTRKVSDTIIPAEWIDNILGNISNFVAVGNYAMEGAPESVDLAWFAVKLTLSAIQNNYDLYTFFGSSLTDISEIMIIIPHYDRLWSERGSSEWKSNQVIDKLFDDIVATYAAVLTFSFSVKRHLSAGTLAKLRHGFKDFWGLSKGKFEGDIKKIATLKQKILEGSEAAFQDKSLQALGSISGVVSSIQTTAAQLEAIINRLDDFKATTKLKTPWELAKQEFEYRRKMLNPAKNTIEALGTALDQRLQGTCKWLFHHPEFTNWADAVENRMLCLTGQQGTGKSVLLASVIEQFNNNAGSSVDAISLYFSCSSNPLSTGIVETICKTLLCNLYAVATHDEADLEILEACNAVFENHKMPKQKGFGLVSHSGTDGDLPDFSEAFPRIAALLGRDVVIALDEVDSLSGSDQIKLFKRLQGLLDTLRSNADVDAQVQVLVACRHGTKFHHEATLHEATSTCLDVGIWNRDDIERKVVNSLKEVPGLTQEEREEAKLAIMAKAGPRFNYVSDVAIPFIREPFQRPLSRRLEALPGGMADTYHDALLRMSSNYLALLRTALTWTLLAPRPPRVEEIMDIFHRRYEGDITGQAHEEDEQNGKDLPDFPRPSQLDIAQLQDASGPFLHVRFDGRSGHHFIHLQDAPQIQEFCLETQDSDHPDVQESESSICLRCRASLRRSASFHISEKHAHLQAALTCLRHINNQDFQRDSCLAARAEFLKILRAEEATEAEKEAERKAQIEAEGDSSTEKAESDMVSDADTSGVHAPEIFGDRVSCDGASDHGATPILEFDPKFRESEPEEDSEYDSDESMDDEDRGMVNLSKGENDDASESGYDGENNYLARPRYELVYWMYHLRVAENLWSEEERTTEPLWLEVMEELDKLISDTPDIFHAWQEGYFDQRYSVGNAYTPFHLAALLGLSSWIEHQLARGADPNELCHRITPLQLTVRHGRGDRAAIMEVLLKNGAEVNTEDGGSPFHTWLYTDPTLESIKMMLDHGADTVSADPNNQATPLHYFARKGDDPEVLELLLNHGGPERRPNLNAKDESGFTPLHILLSQREVPKALLQAFLDHGADPNIDNDSSAQPLQMASRWGEVEVLEILFPKVTDINDDNVDGESALLLAAATGNTECVRFLAKNGADIDQPDRRGRRALHCAALNGHRSCIECLLEHKADLTTTDSHGRTPFFFACLGNDGEDTVSLILDALIEGGRPISEINRPTKRRRTPLRQAAAHGLDLVVAKLIEIARAQDSLSDLLIDEQDTLKGMTALHRAAWHGYDSCVRLLLDVSANASLKDRNGRTALTLAYEQWAVAQSRTSFEEIISLLIAHLPDTSIHDAELVATCAANGSARLLSQLHSLGADLSRQDRYGWTPLELAKKFNQPAAEKFLRQQTAWEGMLPSRWAAPSGSRRGVLVSSDGLKVTCDFCRDRVCIATDKALPAGLERFYFEVKFKPTEFDPTLRLL